ncbi:MAG: antibiotic biosynthesis monooxygenase family protein [Bacteroidota bacterium]
MKKIIFIILVTLTTDLALAQSDLTKLKTTNMNRYGLHGSLKAKEGKVEELAEILIRASELVSTAKGCRLYAVGFDETKPDTVWITEIWDTREDHDNALKIPDVRALIGTAMPLLDGQPVKGQELSIIGGSGITQ